MLDDSVLVGKSLREARFRERFGLVVVGIKRGEESLREELASETLRAGDRILALGARAQLQDLDSQPGFLVKEVGLSALRLIQDHLSVIRIPAGSPLVGSTVGSSRLGELLGVTVGAVLRRGVTRLAVSPDEVIEAGDGLLVACDPFRIRSLVEIGDIELDSRVGQDGTRIRGCRSGGGGASSPILPAG